MRPFSGSAQVQCRSYSVPLQRVVSDFGADVAFGRIPQKLREHHGISIPVSSAQGITELHAAQVHQLQQMQTVIPSTIGVEHLVVELDGTLIPIVETVGTDAAGTPLDRRTTRQTRFKEARLGLARSAQETQPIFGATLGTTEQAAAQLLDCAIAAGLGSNTQVHAVGDGAPWIAHQIEAVFGNQSTYLLDFYHLSEYLAAASRVCAPTQSAVWLEQQQQALKHNRWQSVLDALRPHLEPQTVADEHAPVRVAHRYLQNRPHQLDYQGAISKDLPIGSGEIESAHRHVILERLDIPGAWWTIQKAEQLLSLRVLRKNQKWEDYWATVAPIAA
ncbi:UPF0236 family transposase-like protein [Phormidesmis priestleyi]